MNTAIHTPIVSRYVELVNSLPKLIEISGYRNDYLSKKMGMKTATFSAKKQRGNWQPAEVDQLLQLIINDDVEDYFMLQEMRARKDEETITYEEFKEEIKKWK